jgi:hypothetical protein
MFDSIIQYALNPSPSDRFLECFTYPAVWWDVNSRNEYRDLHFSSPKIVNIFCKTSIASNDKYSTWNFIYCSSYSVSPMLFKNKKNVYCLKFCLNICYAECQISGFHASEISSRELWFHLIFLQNNRIEIWMTSHSLGTLHCYVLIGFIQYSSGRRTGRSGF